MEEEKKNEAGLEDEVNNVGEETENGGDDVREKAEDTDAKEQEESCESSEAECSEESDGPEASETAEEEPKKPRSSVRQKKELAKKDEKIAELTDRLQRSQAEFINYRNRTDREKALRYDDGAMGVLTKVLAVVDDFERGMALVPEDKKDDPYVEGMEKIYKNLMTILEDLGVRPIEAVGAEFDPDFHNAVMHVDEEGAGENVVVEEFQKGYMYKDSVLRHSMVKVAN